MISDKWPQATKHYIIKWEFEITKKNINGEMWLTIGMVIGGIKTA